MASKKNPLLDRNTKLLYAGNNHFIDKNDQLYSVDEVIAILKGATPVELQNIESMGGFHRYSYMNSFTGDYELVIENKYDDIQQYFDQLYKKLAQNKKESHIIDKALIGGAAAFTAFSVGPAVINQMNQNYQNNKQYIEESQVESKLSPIEIYLTGERSKLIGSSALTNSIFNLSDEEIEREAETIMKVFEQKYTTEELQAMVSGGVLTKTGEQAVQIYLRNEKAALYSTDASEMDISNENVNAHISIK